MQSVENKSNGAVATDHPLCSQVGVSILQNHGGNAADAAVASALCLGVVNPTSSGIGGGGFILVHSDDRKMDDALMPLFEDARTDPVRRHVNHVNSTSVDSRMKITEFIDCRETAPQNTSYDMFENVSSDASTLGGLAIAIPGELRGLELLHRRHGSLPWEEVVRPAMELARNGFPVGPHLAEGEYYLYIYIIFE